MQCKFEIKALGPFLITWIASNPSMDKKFHPSYSGHEIEYSFPNLNRSATEVWERVINFIHTCNGCIYLLMLGLEFLHVNKRISMQAARTPKEYR